MKSLGVIETQGLVTAIQAVDAACKAAGVTCIGYRKVGSGLVSVCFEGEISAVHAAIERGVEVAGALGPVTSLVIARPERSVIDALSTLKGHASNIEPVIAPESEPEPEAQAPSAPAPLVEPDDKGNAKKGKR